MFCKVPLVILDNKGNLLQVVALLFSGGDIGERARQSFTGEDRQHADFIALQIGHHLAEIAGDRLHMVTEQRGHRRSQRDGALSAGQ